MDNEEDYVDLGRACVDVCKGVYLRMKGRQPDELDKPTLEAIGILTV